MNIILIKIAFMPLLFSNSNIIDIKPDTIITYSDSINNNINEIINCRKENKKLTEELEKCNTAKTILIKDSIQKIKTINAKIVIIDQQVKEIDKLNISINSKDSIISKKDSLLTSKDKLIDEKVKTICNLENDIRRIEKENIKLTRDTTIEKSIKMYGIRRKDKSEEEIDYVISENIYSDMRVKFRLNTEESPTYFFDVYEKDEITKKFKNGIYHSIVNIDNNNYGTIKWDLINNLIGKKAKSGKYLIKITGDFFVYQRRIKIKRWIF